MAHVLEKIESIKGKYSTSFFQSKSKIGIVITCGNPNDALKFKSFKEAHYYNAINLNAKYKVIRIN